MTCVWTNLEIYQVEAQGTAKESEHQLRGPPGLWSMWVLSRGFWESRHWLNCECWSCRWISSGSSLASHCLGQWCVPCKVVLPWDNLHLKISYTCFFFLALSISCKASQTRVRWTVHPEYKLLGDARPQGRTGGQLAFECEGLPTFCIPGASLPHLNEIIHFH